MLTKNAFDNDRYLHEQTQAIMERVRRFGNKLYLEFGGKLLESTHEFFLNESSSRRWL